MGRPKKNKPSENPQLSEEVTTEYDSIKGPDDCNSRICALYVSEDIPLKQGQINVPVSQIAESNTDVLVVSTSDNSINGLLVEGGKRLKHSFVVPTTFVGNAEIRVTLNIQDETNILRQTQFGTRMDSLVLPKGTHVANLVFL